MAKGLDFLVLINTGTSAAPSFKPIAAQRGATLNRSAETLDVTSKDSEGWKENLAGLKEWSIDADGLLVESDKGFKALEDAYMNSEKIKIQLQTASGNKYEGDAIIVDAPIEAPYDDVATYSFSFTGAGKLTKIAGAGS